VTLAQINPACSAGSSVGLRVPVNYTATTIEAIADAAGRHAALNPALTR
jgi:hypothetical protein